ncbi:DinB family protein [Algoriphagus namhaensis]
MIQDLIFLFDRELVKLEEEVKSYPTEDLLWKKEGEIANSGGTLAVHLCGNLKAFIGKEIGGYEYERNREFEFSGIAIPRENLVKEIQETASWVRASLGKLDGKKLEEKFPVQPFPRELTYQNFLLHLYGHLNYHLGQINYHRRLVSLFDVNK